MKTLSFKRKGIPGSCSRNRNILILLLAPFFLQAQDYCIPATGDCSSEYVMKVSFAGINNESDCMSGYEDYTSATAAQVAAGQAYALSVTLPFSDVAAAAWIDYNQDKLFSSAEYINLGVTVTGNYVLSSTVTVPSGALPGNTRMRVKSQLATTVGANSSCSGPAWGNGETEDYSVAINGTLEVPEFDHQSLTFFPNPSSGSITFVTNGQAIDTVTISDMAGKALLTANLAGNPQLDISKLGAGVYIVAMAQGDRSTVAKLVVK